MNWKKYSCSTQLHDKLYLREQEQLNRACLDLSMLSDNR